MRVGAVGGMREGKYMDAGRERRQERVWSGVEDIGRERRESTLRGRDAGEVLGRASRDVREVLQKDA